MLAQVPIAIVSNFMSALYSLAHVAHHVCASTIAALGKQCRNFLVARHVKRKKDGTDPAAALRHRALLSSRWTPGAA